MTPLSDRELQTLTNMGGISEEAADEITALRQRIAELEANASEEIARLRTENANQTERIAELTAQPPAQPGRGPLSDEQINKGRASLPFDFDDLPEPWSFRQGVRFAEAAHGITKDTP
jgi:hypothetical protein